MIYFISFLFVLVGFILALTKFNYFTNFIGFVLQAIGTATFMVLNYNANEVTFGIIFAVLCIYDTIFAVILLKEYKKTTK